MAPPGSSRTAARQKEPKELIYLGLGPRTEMNIKCLGLGLLALHHRSKGIKVSARKALRQLLVRRKDLSRFLKSLKRRAGKDAGIRDTHATLIHRGSKSQATSGNAFQADPMCDGSLNTLISRHPYYPAVDNLADDDAKVQEFIKFSLDMPLLISEAAEEEGQKLVNRTKERNLPTASLTAECFDADGNFNPDKGCMSRGEYGTKQREIFFVWLKKCTELVPHLKIDIKLHTDVIGASCANPQRPKVRIMTTNPADGNTTDATLEADLVLDCTGTFLAPAVDDEMSEVTYCSYPNHESMANHLDKFGMRDQLKKWRPGRKLLISSALLSSIDDITQAFTELGILTWDDAGNPRCDLNEKEAAGLQGALTIISPSPNFAWPRHVHNNVWHGDQPAITMDEAHSLHLVKMADVGTIWTETMLGSVASTLRIAPNEVLPNEDMVAQLKRYAVENRQYFNAGSERERGRTRPGLIRSFYHATTDGIAPVSDPQEAVKTLSEKAPYTFGQFTSWEFFRTVDASHTMPDVIRTSSNVEHMRRTRSAFTVVAASPVELQNIAARAAELGVLKWCKGKSEEIKYLKDTRTFVYGDEEFHCYMAPPRITPKINPALDEMFPELETEYGLPVYAKGRFLKKRDGNLVHWIDLSAISGGTVVPDATGARSMVSRRTTDTAVRDAGQEHAVVQSYITMTFLNLIDLGHEQPAEALQELYKHTLPSPEAHRTEAEQFEEDWYEIHEKTAALTLLRELELGGRRYHEFYPQVLDKAQRRDAIANLADEADLRSEHFHSQYRERINNIPPFDIMSLNDWDNVYIDPTLPAAVSMFGSTFEEVYGEDA